MKIIELNMRLRQWFLCIDPSDSHICYKTANTPPSRRWIVSPLFLILFILIFDLWCGLGTCHQDSMPSAESKHVLMVSSYGYRIEAYQGFSPAFLSVMEHSDTKRDDSFFDFLDLQDVREKESKQTLFNIIGKKYSRFHLDLIITVPQVLQNFLLEEGKSLFPDVPVLAWISNKQSSTPKRFDTKETGRRVISVYAHLDLKGTWFLGLSGWQTGPSNRPLTV